MNEETKLKRRVYRLKTYYKYREKYILASKKWKEENKESLCKKRKLIRERLNANTRRWYLNNKDKSRASVSRYQAAKLSAIPSWADMKEINWYYKYAAEISELDGIKYNVDHIVPLRNKNVCGLHVQHNLRVISCKENFSKGNRIWPDMP